MKVGSGERGSYALRFFDRVCGIPLVFMLGIFSRRQLLPVNPQRIAFFVPVAIGDTVIFSAVIGDVRRKWPNAELVLLHGANNRSIVPLLEGLDSLVQVPMLDVLSALRRIRGAGTFDLWIDASQWARVGAVFSFFANARYKVGFNTPRQYRHYVYDGAVDHSDRVHELENFRNLVRHVGVEPKGMPSVAVSDMGSGHNEDNKIVTIHAFAGGSKPHLKEWPENNWAFLINDLTAAGYEVHLTGVEVNRLTAESIRAQCANPQKVIVDAGCLSLTDTAQLLRASVFVVSVNTGIMHLASALERPLIALHGPTSSIRWGPLNPEAVSVQSPLQCSPCLNLGFDYGCPRNDCMVAITPDVIKQKIREVKQAIGQ